MYSLQKFLNKEFDKTIKLSDLEIGKKYFINSAKKVTTKFGDSIVITFDFEKEKSVQMFLPKRFSKLSDDDIKHLSNFKFSYHGLEHNLNTETDQHNIKFEPIHGLTKEINKKHWDQMC